MSSKEYLKVNDQKFGQWIHIAQINQSRESVMDVKGFGKKDTQRNLGVSSLTSAPVVHEGIASLWPVSRSVARSRTSGAADSMKIMELSPRELVNKVSGWRFWGNGFSMLI